MYRADLYVTQETATGECWLTDHLHQRDQAWLLCVQNLCLDGKHDVESSVDCAAREHS